MSRLLPRNLGHGPYHVDPTRTMTEKKHANEPNNVK